MNEMTPPKTERAEALKGLGSSRKRVEDARFTQGKGNYVDDLNSVSLMASKVCCDKVDQQTYDIKFGEDSTT